MVRQGVARMDYLFRKRKNDKNLRPLPNSSGYPPGRPAVKKLGLEASARLDVVQIILIVTSSSCGGLCFIPPG